MRCSVDRARYLEVPLEQLCDNTTLAPRAELLERLAEALRCSPERAAACAPKLDCNPKANKGPPQHLRNSIPSAATATPG